MAEWWPLQANIANLVRVRFDVENSPIQRYVKEEYGHIVTEKDASDADIIVEAVENLRRKDDDVYFRAPVAYDDEGVFWYDQKGRMARVELGGFAEKSTLVQVDPEFDNHFLGIIMEYLVNFKLLSHGACLCHASAIDYEGVRVLFPAWRHSSKTNLMLHFLQQGGRYIADDWVILFRDGSALPLPKRLHLLYYNFIAYPHLVDELDPESRALIKFTTRATRGEYDLDLDVIDAIRQKVRFRRPIQDMDSAREHLQRVPVNMVMLLQRKLAAQETVSVNERNAQEMTALIEPILWFEQMHFHTAYAAHKLWAGRPIPYLENCRDSISDILVNAFNNIPGLLELAFVEKLDVKIIAERVRSAMTTRNIRLEKNSIDTGAS
jgi:hypothetical protein